MAPMYFLRWRDGFWEAVDLAFPAFAVTEVIARHELRVECVRRARATHYPLNLEDQ